MTSPSVWPLWTITSIIPWSSTFLSPSPPHPPSLADVTWPSQSDTSRHDVIWPSLPDTSGTNVTLPAGRGWCEVGAVVEKEVPDLSIFRLFPAPSQPPERRGWEVGVKVVLYVLAMGVALLGNVLVVAIIGLTPRMRSTTNLLLVNQALADLLVALVCMWVHLGNSLTPEWPFGPLVCKVNTFCQVTSVTASVLTLTVISLERLTAIVWPLRGRWRPMTTAVTMALTWTLAVGLASPHLMVHEQVTVLWLDREEVWCAEHWPLVYRDELCHTWQPAKVVYYSVSGIVMYLVPVVIMTVVYSVVTFTLVTRKMPGAVINSTRSAQDRAKRKVIKMLIAVLVAFVLCWTPQQCMLLYDVFRDSDQVPVYLRGVKYGALYLAYLNSALNPILYGGFNDNFRRGFRDIFHCIRFRRTVNKIHPAAKRAEEAAREAGVRKGGGEGERENSRPDGSRHGASSLTIPHHHLHRHPPLNTVSTRLTSQRLQMTELTHGMTLSADPQPSLPHPSPSSHHSPHRLCRRLHSDNSDDTMDIAWHALV